MKETIYVTGHRNPDSDSICSALSYAYLKRQLGYDAKACRLGKVNYETKFILDKFGIEAPELMSSAKATLKEIVMDPAVTVNKNATIRHVWDLCLEYNTKTIYVIDEKRKLVGLTTMSDVSKIQMQDLNLTKDILKDTPLKNLVASLKGSFILEGTLPRSGYVRIFDKKMMDRDLTGNIMVLSDNEDAMIKCMNKGCSVIAISEGFIPGEFIIKMAKELGVTLITTPYNIMKILQMIYRSIPVGLIVANSDNIVSFNGNEYVEDVQKIMLKTRYRNYPVFLNGELTGSLARYHLMTYAKKNFILVDHNEVSQTIDDIEYGNILEIIDHHRIGDIETNQPIIFRNQRVGSTCTIIASMFKEEDVEIPQNIAGILCCGIISDTMNFNSPTCTKVDRKIAEELANQHQIDLNKLSKEMFVKTATLEGKDNKHLLYTDFKEYELDGYHIAIGQTNIFDLSSVDEISEDFQNYLEEENERFKYDLLMMVFSNVEGKGSKFLFTGKISSTIATYFRNNEKDNFLEGFVSRKKQIIPKIASLLK